MAKKVIAQIKLQLEAGKATPAPPVGPALGQHGVNIMGFCKQFNAETSDKAGIYLCLRRQILQFHPQDPASKLLATQGCGYSERLGSCQSRQSR